MIRADGIDAGTARLIELHERRRRSGVLMARVLAPAVLVSFGSLTVFLFVRAEKFDEQDAEREAEFAEDGHGLGPITGIEAGFCRYFGLAAAVVTLAGTLAPLIIGAKIVAREDSRIKRLRNRARRKNLAALSVAPAALPGGGGMLLRVVF